MWSWKCSDVSLHIFGDMYFQNDMNFYDTWFWNDMIYVSGITWSITEFRKYLPCRSRTTWYDTVIPEPHTMLFWLMSCWTLNYTKYWPITMTYFKNTKHWNVLNLCIAITIACTSTMACHLLFSTTAGLGLAPLLALTTTSLHRTCTRHDNFMVLRVWNPLLRFVIVCIVFDFRSDRL